MSDLSSPGKNDLLKLAHSPIHNYIVPGLISWLVSKGDITVRLFEMTHHQQVYITPHSHRYGFTAVVLRGSVTNTLFVNHTEGKPYRVSNQLGKLGEYKVQEVHNLSYVAEKTTYGQGQSYSMSHREIHSINFSDDALVLMIEGPAESESSYFLEPIVEGKKIPTHRTENWMFLK